MKSNINFSQAVCDQLFKMENTKQRYIEDHPRSYLAQKLSCNDWPEDAEIGIIGGLEAPNNKSSNLYCALRGTTGEYVRGGHRQRGTEGFWFAIRI